MSRLIPYEMDIMEPQGFLLPCDFLMLGAFFTDLNLLLWGLISWWVLYWIVCPSCSFVASPGKRIWGKIETVEMDLMLLCLPWTRLWAILFVLLLYLTVSLPARFVGVNRRLSHYSWELFVCFLFFVFFFQCSLELSWTFTIELR